VDSAGHAYVTGYTFSPTFPTTAGAFQTAHGSAFDGFVAKFAFGPAVIPFAAFTAAVAIEAGAGEFDVTGTFTLGAGSEGIHPPKEEVTLQLGAFSLTIPAGAFEQKKRGKFTFAGAVGGVEVEATIKPVGGSAFKFTIEGEGAADLPTQNPVPVTLVIGDDSGTTAVTAEFEGGEQE
jgi:hypothetical protein